MKEYLIYSVDRQNTAFEAMEAVDLVIKYKHRSVARVDFCGDFCKGDITVFRDTFAGAKNAGLYITLNFG